MNEKYKVRMGFAEVDITPSGAVQLVGFDRENNISRGVRDKLVAQILIWDDLLKRCCMICIDSLGFTTELTDRLRQAVANKLDISRKDVMLCFSHTHAAPNAAEEKGYFDYVCAQVSLGVDLAVQNCTPAKAAWGVAEADIGVNRRNKNGLLDKRIGILKVVDAASDELKLILLRVTAHANVLSSDNYLISADYFGKTRECLEKEYGCRVVLTQGASGNVRPKYQHSMAKLMEEHPREAMEKAKNSDVLIRLATESTEAIGKMADAISNSIVESIQKLRPQPIYRFGMFSENAVFFADVPVNKRAEEIVAEAKKEANIDGTRWLAEVERLHREKTGRQSAEIEIQFFILNEGCLCGIPNEAMCEIALDIAQKCKDKFIFFGGYTNGIDGYLPTEEEYYKGGYEVLWAYLVYYPYYGRVMPLNFDTAEKLACNVAERWDKIKCEAISEFNGE